MKKKTKKLKAAPVAIRTRRIAVAPVSEIVPRASDYRAKERNPAPKRKKTTRKVTPGGWARGERHHNAKLSDAQRRLIIKASYKGSSQGSLARKYGVHQSTIRNVILNNQWVMRASA